MKEVTVIPVKVELLCHLYKVLKHNQGYLQWCACHYDDEEAGKDWEDNKWTLALLENQIKLGVKYAK